MMLSMTFMMTLMKEPTLRRLMLALSPPVQVPSQDVQELRVGPPADHRGQAVHQDTAHCTLHTAHCTLHTAHYNLHTVHYLSFKSRPMSSGVWCHQDRWGLGWRGGVNKCAATLPRRVWHNLPTSVLQKIYCSPAYYCVTPPVYGAVQCTSCIVLQPVWKQDTAGLAARASRRRTRALKADPILGSISRLWPY